MPIREQPQNRFVCQEIQSFYKDGTDGLKAYVFGAEYETHSFMGFKKSLAEHDVPCAVCLVRNRSAVNMFPGR